ncbi:hypothetical protein F1880_005052 [Penicillium rolfsii]|nr:hypothetical protein F1880_005052 [Penicillium rolfsii]
MADITPDALLWGSDWPHVDSTKRSDDTPVASERVDTDKELELLQSWLSDRQWRDMLVNNPEKLFAK